MVFGFDISDVEIRGEWDGQSGVCVPTCPIINFEHGKEGFSRLERMISKRQQYVFLSRDGEYKYKCLLTKL